MSGKTKQAHRTKNNVRPSSSGRSAELLSSMVNPALVMVGPGNLLPSVFPSLAGPTIDPPVSNEFLLCFKKFHKKDPITKLKALNELNDLVAKSEQDEVVNALGNWAHYYPSLTVDTDRKVREATQTCHGAIVRKCGRRVAPHLKRLLPAWLMAQHDEHAPVQRVAQAHLQATFPNEKLAEAVKFCKEDICNLYMDNLKGNAEYMLSGKKVEDEEERAAVVARVTSCTLRALRLLLVALPAAHDDWLWDALLPLLCARSYWQLAHHPDNHVRAAFYQLTGAALARFPARLPADMARRAARSLVAPDSAPAAPAAPAAARERWRTLLHVLLHVPDFLDLIEHNLLEKRLWEVFENVAWGEAQQLHEALPALLALLPGDMQSVHFYDRLFTTLFKGLRQTSLLNDETEREHWTGVIAATLRYVSTAHRLEPEAVALVGRAHRTWLHAALAAPPALLASTAARMAALVDHWARSAADAGNLAFSTLTREFWLNVRAATADLEHATGDVVRPVAAHLQIVLGLKRALDAPPDPADPADPPATDLVRERYLRDLVRERCLRDLAAAADELIGRVLLLAHAQRTVPSILPVALPALDKFDSPKLLTSLARKFGAESVLKFYEDVLRAWLADDEQRCEAVVDLVFLVLQHLDDIEQDAVFDSFEKLSPEVVRWCLWRVARGGAGAAAARWLRDAAAERALGALVALHEEPSARELLLAAVTHTHNDEVVIRKSAVRRIVAACCSLLEEVAGGGAVRLAARLAGALSGVRGGRGGLPLLLALFRVTLHIPRGSPALEDEVWSAARGAWRDGSRLPALRHQFLTDALRQIHCHLLQDVENLDIPRIDHVVSLCTYFLEGESRDELVALARQVLVAVRGEGEGQGALGPPLEVFALQVDAIWGDLSCPLEDDSEWLAAALGEGGRGELARGPLVARAKRMLFRACYLRTALQRDGLDRAQYFQDQFCDVLYDYAVLDVLYDHYAFWKHYDIIRAAKERMEQAVSDMVARLPGAVHDAVAGALLERALRQGYYWAHASRQYERAARAARPPDDRFSDAVEEPERTDSQQSHSTSSFEILDASESVESDAPCPCHRLRGSPHEVFAPLLLGDVQPAGGAPGRAGLRAELASRCERAASYRDFLSEMMLRSGYFHVAQMKALEEKKKKQLAKAKFDEQQDTALTEFEVTGRSEVFARWREGPDAYAALGVAVDERALYAAKEYAMVRAYYCVAAARAPLDQLVADIGAEGGRCNLDAVINGYYRHNDTMLFERSLAGASWLQLSGTAATLDLLAEAVTSRGWGAPALHWDFTNIALCSALTSLALSADMFTAHPLRLALVARPALELYARVRQFIGGVRRECTRREPSAHVAALPREWEDIFAPDATKNLLLLICHVLDNSSRTVCAAQAAVLCALTGAARLLEARAVPAVERTGALSLERAVRAATRALADTAHHGYKYLAYYTLRSLAPAMIAADEARMAALAAAPAVADDAEDEEDVALDGLSLALYDDHLDQLQELVDAALSDYTLCDDLCEMAPHTDSHAVVLGHLLLGVALHRHCELAAGDLAHHYHTFYNTHGYVEGILSAALRLLPPAAVHLMAARLPALPKTLLPCFIRLQDFDLRAACTSATVSRLACGAALRALGGPGAGAARGWWALLPARAGAGVARLVAAAVAPPLLNHQLAEVREHGKDLRPSAKVSLSVSERSARCELCGEASGEEGDEAPALRVSLSATHPLRAPRVHSAPPGPDPHVFAVYLGYRNGRVMEAMRMWVAAAVAAAGAAGGAPCYVCYCRAHPLDRSEPGLHCRQCRNVFHARCIRRWFKMSNRSNCPVCRTNF